MEKFDEFDLVLFAVLGTWYVSKLYRVEGTFGYVDYFVGKNDGDLFSNGVRLQRVLNLVSRLHRHKQLFLSQPCVK